MANIKKELNDIKNAVYGREVRGSIHNGIKKINDEVENATDLSESAKHQVENIQQQVNQLVVEGDSSVEAAQARVDAEGKSFPTLKARLDEKETKFAAQLAETDDQSFMNRPISRWNRPNRPMLVFHDDDGFKGFYTKLFQVAKEYNIPITSAMITGAPMGFPGDSRPYDNKYYHYDEVMEMKDSGLVEFVSHTHNNVLNLDQAPREIIREELELSRDFMKKWGFNHRVVVIPGGHISDRVIDEARQVYEYMTTWGGYNKILKPPFSNYTIYRGSMDQEMEGVKALLDEASENTAGLILRTHVDASSRYTNDRFREIIEYALSKDFDIVTTEELLKSHANILEVSRDELIAADGSFHGKRLGRVILDSDMEVDSSTPLTDFEPNTITYNRITSGNTSGFPGSPSTSSGVLKTTRIHDSNMFWNTQEFQPNSVDISYVRHWATSETFDPFGEVSSYPGWTNWKARTNSHYKRQNSYNSNTKIDDYFTGITTEHITSAGYNDDLPANSGQLTTYKTNTTTTGLQYQEFVPYNRQDKYLRHATPTGWTDWVRVNSLSNPPINTYNGETPPSSFLRGVTEFYVSSDSAGLPTGSSGNFTTRKEAGLGRSWQLFRPASSSGLFFRGEGNDGNWLGWKRIMIEDV